jgi:hypothetical protein
MLHPQAFYFWWVERAIRVGQNDKFGVYCFLLAQDTGSHTLNLAVSKRWPLDALNWVLWWLQMPSG